MGSVDVSGRVKIIDGCPPALPGKCVMCGACQDRKFIDIGFDLDYYGVVYFCECCFTEVAAALDYHPPRQWKMLMGEVEEQRGEINMLKDQNDLLRSDMDALARVSGFTGINGTSGSSVDEVSQESDAEAGQPDINPPDRKEGSPQPAHEPRRSNIQYDDSLDDFIDAL